MNLNLTRLAIDTSAKLFIVLMSLKDHKVKHVKINEIQHAVNYYVNFNSIMKDIIPDVGPASNMGYYSKHGCQNKEQFLSRLFNMDILIKRSCFMVMRSLKPSENDLFKSMNAKAPKHEFCVIYEDGSIYPTWLKFKSATEGLGVDRLIEALKEPSEPTVLSEVIELPYACHGAGDYDIGAERSCHGVRY